MARAATGRDRPRDVRVRRQRCPARSRRWARRCWRASGSVDVLVNSAGINVPRAQLRGAVARRLACGDRHQPARRVLLRPRLSAGHAGAAAPAPSSTSTRTSARSPAISPGRPTSRRSSVCSGLTQQINAEERGNGVRACSICPRDINTPLLDKRRSRPRPKPGPRMLQPDDIADCAGSSPRCRRGPSSRRFRCRQGEEPHGCVGYSSADRAGHRRWRVQT